MNIVLTPWDFRALWTSLPLLSKLYLVVLLIAASYSTAMLLKIIFRRLPSGARSRLENLQQLHMWLLLLFGVCFADQVFATFRSVSRWAVSLSAASVDVFNPAVAFAFVTLLALLVLHSLEWFTSFRIRKKEGTS
jgi:hypothetical protein